MSAKEEPTKTWPSRDALDALDIGTFHNTQRLRNLKHRLLTPIASSLTTWATRAPSTRTKAFALRRIVAPSFRAQGRQFQRRFDDGRVFCGNTRDVVGLYIY